MPGIVVAPWLVAFAAPGLFLLASTEDGPIEGIGALFYLIAGAGFIASAVTGGRRGLLPTALLLGLAGVLLLAFGEEVSWGQRFFGWETPSSVAAANVQEETTLHNLALFDCHIGCSGTLIHRDAAGNLIIDLQRLFTLGILALLVVPPIATAASRRLRRLASALALPIASPMVAMLALAVFALSRVALTTLPPGDAWAARELMEAEWGLLLAALALATLAAVRAATRNALLSNGK
ncbi:MAG: hypothetical protein O3C25_01985 [Chloroflexi bacterium]|nr:hypothetical protein [Chloroflexota bacterium]